MDGAKFCCQYCLLVDVDVVVVRCSMHVEYYLKLFLFLFRISLLSFIFFCTRGKVAHAIVPSILRIPRRSAGGPRDLLIKIMTLIILRRALSAGRSTINSYPASLLFIFWCTYQLILDCKNPNTHTETRRICTTITSTYPSSRTFIINKSWDCVNLS